MTLEVTPEPTPEELRAIEAALRAVEEAHPAPSRRWWSAGLPGGEEEDEEGRQASARPRRTRGARRA